MPKIDPYAVSQLDKIIRAIRTAIERNAAQFAAEGGNELANKDDVNRAALVVFESDSEHCPKVLKNVIQTR
jgi:hypothetical protein